MKGTKLTRNLWILLALNESYAQASQVANGKNGTWCANDIITEQIFPTNEKLKQRANWKCQWSERDDSYGGFSMGKLEQQEW